MGVFILCKLVSACSGPILLIMEFAQHGSLRTYLHKCRGQRGQEEEHHQVPVIIIITIIITIIIIGHHCNQQVTTRDILCFSWQVARGMEYLSNKKVSKAVNEISR